MKIAKLKIKNSRGFMMVEVLVVASIITVSVLAAMAVAQKSVYVSRQALHNLEAGFLLEEGVEAVRILRDNSWDNISALSPATDYYPLFSGGSWTLSITPQTIGIFTRKINVASVNRDDSSGAISPAGTDDPGTKLITATVSWPEGGATPSKTLPFYIMDIF